MNVRAAVVTALIAAPLIWLNEHVSTEQAAPLRLIPAEDSARFARCRANGGFIEYGQERDAEYGSPFTRALWCEEKP